MFPYLWGSFPADVAAAETFNSILRRDVGFNDLPEEVREGIERRRDEIKSTDDMRGMANDMMMRR